MATGGPISPSSFYPGTSQSIYQDFFTGGGGNAAATEEGICVSASLAADATCILRFPTPPTIPALGTLKARILMLTSDTTAGHVAKLTIQDAAVSAGASPSAATLNSETQLTFTLPATPAGKYVEQKQGLTSSPAGNDMIVMAITFNGAGAVWTVNQKAYFLVTIIWE